MTNNSPSLRNILYELSLAKSVPDAELLDEFIRRYPEHATDLTEFAVALVLDAAGEIKDQPPESTSTSISTSVSRAMSRFHNRLYEIEKAGDRGISTSSPSAENPFASLNRSKIRTLTQRLGVNTVFVMKLRDRVILPNTMTSGFQQYVANGLDVSDAVICSHFAAQPVVQPHAYFKADQKPEVNAQQTFEEAVRSSGLTPEQQKYLLSL